MSIPQLITKAVEESPGNTSMMRWIVRGCFYIYLGTVSIVTALWVTISLIDFFTQSKHPDYKVGLMLIGVTGGTILLGLIGKVAQKKFEVDGEMKETEYEALKEMDANKLQ